MFQVFFKYVIVKSFMLLITPILLVLGTIFSLKFIWMMFTYQVNKLEKPE